MALRLIVSHCVQSLQQFLAQAALCAPPEVLYLFLKRIRVKERLCQSLTLDRHDGSQEEEVWFGTHVEIKSILKK